MKAFARSHNLADDYRLISILGGIFIALSVAFILRYPYVWAGLVALGLVVGVLSLTAKDFKTYWLAIFALVLPLEIKKMLIDSEPVRDFVQTYGFPVGELPGPVLYLSDLPFLVLMIYWLFEVTFRKQKIFLPKSNLMALAFVIWSGVSLVNATVFSSGFFDLLRIVKFYLLYLYAANNFLSKKAVKTLIKFLLLGMILQGLLCLYQYLAQDRGYILANLLGQQDLYTETALKKVESLFSITQEGAIRRGRGTVGPANAEAQYFEFLLPVAFLLWATATKFLSYSFNLTTFILGLLGLIVTFSRGGLVGITIGIVAVLLLSRWFQLISNKKLLTFCLIGLGLSTVISPIVYEYMITRPEAASARLHLAKVGLEMVKAHPILGVGLNNHLVLMPEYDPRSYALPMPSHNQYIIIASEVGIPGLVFFLGFLALTFRLALGAARADDLYIASVAVGILGALVSIALHIQVDYLGTNTAMTLLWLYGGLAAALNQWNAKPSEMTLKNENRAD
ncbi:MAG: hypothetical protein GTO24_15690 [candidate division Zixibacteria bacterium]|nr:hypothetical protein [candidate division Zixibacteria bacterium]